MEDFDHNEDRYPIIQDVLQSLPSQPDFPEGPVERIEVTALANGDYTWRVWPARAEEPASGSYITG